MPFTKEEIDDIAAECFASDVPYRIAQLQYWEEDAIREWFENGGEPADTSLPVWLQSLHQTHPDIGERLIDLSAGKADETGGADSGALSTSDLVTVREAISARKDWPDDDKLLCTALLRSLATLHDDEAAPTAAAQALLVDHFRLLVEVCSAQKPAHQIDLGNLWDFSPKGRANAPMGGATGVLLLGYGGGSLAALGAYAEVYKCRWPQWLMLTHAGPLLFEDEGFAFDKMSPSEPVPPEHPSTKLALDALVEACTHCESLIVHVMSNMGHGVWCHLLRREGTELTQRVRAMVYDCAASPLAYFTPGTSGGLGPGAGIVVENSHRIILATVKARGVSLMLRHRKALGAAAKACAAAEERAVGPPKALGLAVPDEYFEWQVAADPSAPAICLTSAEDSLIREAGVRAFAGMLQKAQPSRSVRVIQLRGEHVTFHASDKAEYYAAIHALVEEAGLTRIGGSQA